MKKLLAFMFLGMLMSINANSAEFFKYKNVIGCGPKEVMHLDDLPGYEAWQYFLIHIAETGHVVIYNDEYQFATFEKKNYSQLWNQNHKITSLKTKKDDVTSIYQFELISEFEEPDSDKDTKLVNFFNLNVESMTFTYRRVGYPSKKKYEPQMGICWRIL